MRGNFATGQQRSAGFRAEGNRAYADLASSIDQIAVVWSGTEGVVVASPQRGAGGTMSVDVVRFPSDFNLGAAVEMRRRNQLGLPAISDRTLFSTVVPDFSERTRILHLDGERLALDEDYLHAWLVNAEQQMLLGTDNHPIFETSLEDTACSIDRLPNGQVAMTEVPRQHVANLKDRIRPFAGPAAAAQLNLIVETPVRCAARYFLSGMREGEAVRRPGKETEVTAFLLIRKAGFSLGLWSPRTGLFDEYSFLAPKDLGQNGAGTADAAKKRAAAKQEGVQSQRFDAYIRQAFDQLYLQLSPERLEQLDLTSYAQAVWACDVGLAEQIAPVANEYSEKSGLDMVQVTVPADEAVAAGLLFGSFGFGEPEAAGARIVPTVNLARDLLVLADTEAGEQRRLGAIEAAKRRNRAIFTILAAPTVALALLFAYTANLVREQVTLAIRESRADAHTQELKPALDRRRSYEANLQWYQEFVKQVSGLRKQQPVGIGLLYQLDSNYPVTIDPSFYVSEMRMSPKGDLEIKGLARNKDAIASFLKALEFAGGSESGSRLFSNLTYEVQEGAPAQANVAGRPGAPAITGSTLTSSNVAPGVIAWSLRGNYLPVAGLVPPDPAAKPPGQPPGAPAATPVR
jgi:hypothetical protein